MMNNLLKLITFLFMFFIITFFLESINEMNVELYGLIEGDFLLEISELENFEEKKIKEKTIISTNFKNELYITDARGIHEGWILTITSYPFKIKEPNNGWVKENEYNLPIGSLSINNVKSIEGLSEEMYKFYPETNKLNVVIDNGQALKILYASNKKGMGKYKLLFKEKNIKLVLEKKTFKKDKINYPVGDTIYESIIIWDLISGPN